MFSNYCKICGISKDESNSILFFPLFESSDDPDEICYTKDGSKFVNYIFEEAYPKLGYPEFICQTCQTKLSDFDEFRDVAIQTHTRITDMLNENQTNSAGDATISKKLDTLDLTMNNEDIEGTEETVEYTPVNEDKISEGTTGDYIHSNSETNQMFRCKMCWVAFDTVSLLVEHMNEHLTCPICSLVCTNKKNLDIHLTKHVHATIGQTDVQEQEKLDVSEEDCNVDMNDVVIVDPIIDQIDLENVNAVNSSNSVIVTEYTPNSENSPVNSNENKIFPCPKCNRIYTYEVYLHEHLKIRHKQESINMDNIVSGTSSKLLKRAIPPHFKTDTNSGIACNKLPSLKQDSPNHLLEHYIKLKRKNAIDDVRIYQKPNLKEIRANKNNKVQCRLCLRTYVNKRNLRVHYLNIHAPTKPPPPARKNICSVCGKKFVLPSQLRNHEFRHTNERPLKCDICGKYYKLTRDLELHIRIHMKKSERRYCCELCGKSFYEHRQLKDHAESHSDIRLYECEVCHAKLKTRITLDSHMAHFHKKAGKYQCMVCEAMFAYRNRIMSHIKIHIKKGIIKADEVENYIKQN